jgi:hypothetical protein
MLAVCWAALVTPATPKSDRRSRGEVGEPHAGAISKKDEKAGYLGKQQCEVDFAGPSLKRREERWRELMEGA